MQVHEHQGSSNVQLSSISQAYRLIFHFSFLLKRDKKELQPKTCILKPLNSTKLTKSPDSQR